MAVKSYNLREITILEKAILGKCCRLELAGYTCWRPGHGVGDLLASAGDVVAEVGVGDQLAECHVGAADRGAGDDRDQGVDLGGGLHALHCLSDCLAQHDG